MNDFQQSLRGRCKVTFTWLILTVIFPPAPQFRIKHAVFLGPLLHLQVYSHAMVLASIACWGQGMYLNKTGWCGYFLREFLETDIIQRIQLRIIVEKSDNCLFPCLNDFFFGWILLIENLRMIMKGSPECHCFPNSKDSRGGVASRQSVYKKEASAYLITQGPLKPLYVPYTLLPFFPPDIRSEKNRFVSLLHIVAQEYQNVSVFANYNNWLMSSSNDGSLTILIS